MMIRSRSSALLAAVCLLAASARADTVLSPEAPFKYFPNDATSTNIIVLDGPYTAIVGFDGLDPATGNFLNPTSPTLTFTTSGVWQYDMYAFQASTINLNGGDGTARNPGGYIQGALYLGDTSTANVSGFGQALEILSFDHSSVTISGGSVGITDGLGQIHGGLSVEEHSTATISGGILSSAGAVAGGKLTFSGGQITSVGALDGGMIVMSGGTATTVTLAQGAGGGASTLLMSGGKVIGDVAAEPGCTAHVDNGIIGGELGAYGGSVYLSKGNVASVTVDGITGFGSISDGNVTGNVVAENGSSLLVSGGTLGLLQAFSGSTVTVQGGTIAGPANSNSGESNATFNIVGDCVFESDVNGVGGRINMSTGTIQGNLIVQGNCLLLITGGNIQGALQSQGTSFASAYGVTVTGAASSLNSSTFVINDGNFSVVTVQDSSTMSIYGGTISQGIGVNNSGTLILSAGVVDGALDTRNASYTYINGGYIDGGVDAYDTSTVTYNGGVVFGIRLHDKATLALNGLTGPAAPHASAAVQPFTTPNSTMPIYLYDSSTLQVNGINLTATLLDAVNSGGMFSEYQLGGFFADGTPIAGGAVFYVQNTSATSAATFTLVSAGQKWLTKVGGSWSNTANWVPKIIADGAGSQAVFGTGSFGFPITLDGNRTVGDILINNPSYQVHILPGSGGTLVINNRGSDAAITVSGPYPLLPVPALFEVPVLLQDNTTVFVADLNLESDTTFSMTQGVTVSQGKTLTKTGPGTLSTTSVLGGTLNIQQGAITINHTIGIASAIDGLIVSSGAVLNLVDSDLLIHNTTPDAITQLVKTGFGNGAWNGRGIVTSTNGQVYSWRALGVLSGADYLALNPGQQFDDYDVAPTDVLIGDTAFGDANLDFDLSIDDYLQIDRGYLQHLTGWVNGDFNYDGTVDYLDYALMDAAFAGVNATQAAGEISLHTQEFGAPYLAALNADGLPEPATLMPLLIGASALLHRRQRRNTKTPSPVS